MNEATGAAIGDVVHVEGLVTRVLESEGMHFAIAPHFAPAERRH
jgi:hypothetical protein